MSGLDFWLLFFRSKSIGEILQEANARLKSHQKRITKGGLYKAIGLLYALTLDVRRQRWDYCATASADDLCPTPAFSVRFGMVRDHFQQILAALSFGPAEDGRGPWLSENALINMHLCICPTSAMERRHCLNSFTNIQSLIVSCYQGQRWVAKQAKSAYFKHFQDLGTGITFCLNVRPEALPAGQELRSAIINIVSGGRGSNFVAVSLFLSDAIGKSSFSFK